MYAKSFIAHASRGRLTSAATAKTYPYDRYVCHLCKSALIFHPEWGTHRPWFEHTADTLTENGREHCPYVTVVLDELPLIQRLRRLVKDTYPLVLHAGMPGESPWFEHDQHTVATNILMKCAHLDPQVKADVRLNQLRKAIGELDAHASLLSWYCAWCGSHYHGAKLCSACGTGIYSIEEVNWQANYA